MHIHNMFKETLLQNDLNATIRQDRKAYAEIFSYIFVHVYIQSEVYIYRVKYIHIYIYIYIGINV